MRRLELNGQPLDLDLTLSCGQAFRWRRRDDGVWSGVVRDRLIELAVDGGSLWWRTYPEDDEALVRDYLRLHDDLRSIYRDLASRDPHLQELTLRFHGLRLLRQDPTETLLSFVCSAANSIPRITAAIEAICESFGDIVCEKDSGCYHAFPNPSRLARADRKTLEETHRLGFRGANLQMVARQIVERGEDWLLSLRGVPYPQARERLLSIRCVGMKIADCVCLFALDKDEAVPVDTHVRQLAQRLWMPDLTTRSITDAVYRRIATAFAERYGGLAGWAQQFLYYEDLLRTRALGRGLG